MSEKFELCSSISNKCTAKSESPRLFIVVPSVFVIHVVTGAQFLKTNWVAGAARIVRLPVGGNTVA